MPAPESLQALADEYAQMATQIKANAQGLADLRKALKKLDATLLVEMTAQNVSEVASGGMVITRSSKLTAK